MRLIDSYRYMQKLVKRKFSIYYDAGDITIPSNICNPDNYLRGIVEGMEIAALMLGVEPVIEAAEVIKCKDCKLFSEYTDEYKQKTNADGDCSVRVWFADDELFCRVKCDDYCSYAKRKEVT